MLIDVIAGARPNFVKISSIIKAIIAHNKKKPLVKLKFRLIHTGQHYDTNLSEVFFEELGIPSPDHNLETGSGSQAEQTSKIMIGYESLLKLKRPDICLVVGDVNSTMACAITSQKMHIPVAHVEAGIRSGDWKMPEEINRLVTDSITNLFFTTTLQASDNLLSAGVNKDSIFFVGNTMIDTLIANKHRLKKPSIWGERNLMANNFLILTLHRPSNVDHKESLEKIIRTLEASIQNIPIVFPAHPRTFSNLNKIRKLPDNLIITKPLSYLEFNYLLKNSKAVITDSGGITEEATYFNVPCMTLRNTTERPETISVGTNELIGDDPKNLTVYLNKLLKEKWKSGSIPEKWDGKSSTRIVKEIERFLSK